MEVPCGKCCACRIARTREWTTRLLHELSTHERSAFITLTYSDEFISQNGTLVKRDLQLFFKRLRHFLDQKIKYFACGEYGDEEKRPHYHAIIFGWQPELEDLYYLGFKKGRKRYASRFLEQLWTYGFNEVGTVEHDSIRYVAGYVQKKYNSEKAQEEYGDNERPFQLQSQGIGLEYALKNQKYFIDKKGTTVNGHEVGLPRYYRKKLNLRPEEFRKRAEKREIEKQEYLDSKTEDIYEQLKIVQDDRRMREKNILAREKLFKKGSL